MCLLKVKSQNYLSPRKVQNGKFITKWQHQNMKYNKRMNLMSYTSDYLFNRPFRYFLNLVSSSFVLLFINHTFFLLLFEKYKKKKCTTGFHLQLSVRYSIVFVEGLHGVLTFVAFGLSGIV